MGIFESRAKNDTVKIQHFLNIDLIYVALYKINQYFFSIYNYYYLINLFLYRDYKIGVQYSRTIKME